MSTQEYIYRLFGDEEYDQGGNLIPEDSENVPPTPLDNSAGSEDFPTSESDNSEDSEHVPSTQSENSDDYEHVPSTPLAASEDLYDGNYTPTENNYVENSDLQSIQSGSLYNEDEDYSDGRFSKGKYFSCYENLFKSYKEHGRRKGFGVVKRNSNDRYARFTCDKGGSKSGQFSKRINCPAALNAKKEIDGSYSVTSVVHEHSHDLDPAHSIFITSHRLVSDSMKRHLDSHDVAGVRPNKNIRICEVQSGGPMNLGCIPKDCRNYIHKRRRLRLGDGDAEAVRNMLARIQLQEPNFFHLMDIDSRGRLCNVLWIHPRSRAAYQEFHDVVSFDTTYRVNRYNMPFASFVGINHHGQSILLGCALVSHENAESFRWLFRNWLQAMNGVHPNAIITDQCASIRKAVLELMPDTTHRLCIWHIISKVPKYLKGVANYSECVVELKAAIYDSLDISTFESKWREFLEKYRLVQHPWLTHLYNERQRWVPVYLNHKFWGGMLSTQRSEGMHAYFDEFLHSRNTLQQFMEHYDMAVANKILKEFHADFHSRNKELECTSDYGWERQFQKEYTTSMFKLVKEQVRRLMHCHFLPLAADEVSDYPDEIKKYKVLERCIMNNYYFKEYTFMVEWRPNGSYVSCNCKKFEFKGIMCCHSLKVLAEEDVQTVHPRYVLDRWKKTIHRPHSRIFSGGGYPNMSQEFKNYQEVDKLFQECIDVGFGSQDMMSWIKAKCREMKAHLLGWGDGGGVSDTHTPANDLDVDSGPSQTLRDPPVIVSKGRPRGPGRILSSAELAVRSQGRGRAASSSRRS